VHSAVVGLNVLYMSVKSFALECYSNLQFSLFSFCLNSNELTYSVILVSGVQFSDLVIQHLHTIPSAHHRCPP